MFRKLICTGVAIATAAVAAPALAQSGQRYIEEIEVTSTSRRSEGLADINAAVSVLG